MEEEEQKMETRFNRHLAKGSEIEVEGEKYVLKPLGTSSLPDFFKAMKAFSHMNKDSKPEDFMKNMSDESMSSIQRLIETTLEKSFPEEWKANNEEVKAFGMKYFMILLPKIFEMNSAETQTIEQKKIERIKDRLGEKVV